MQTFQGGTQHAVVSICFHGFAPDLAGTLFVAQLPQYFAEVGCNFHVIALGVGLFQQLLALP